MRDFFVDDGDRDTSVGGDILLIVLMTIVDDSIRFAQFRLDDANVLGALRDSHYFRRRILETGGVSTVA